MATSPLNPLLVATVLQILRDNWINGRQGQHARRIYGRLADGLFSRYLARGSPESLFAPGFSEQKVQEVLESLEGLGLVTADGALGEPQDRRSWRIADSWQPPIPPLRGNGRDDGNGDSGDGGPGGNRNDGDDGEGGGLREVLAHPRLFALEREGFVELVNGMFSEDGPQ